MAKKIVLSDVLKKDLKVVGYLLSFGFGAYVAQRFITDNEVLSLVCGAAINYILFRIEKELAKEGYREALKRGV